MENGVIPINKNYELEFRYYDKDPSYKYFNRKFEVFLLEKKTLKKTYLLHMDNADSSDGSLVPHIYKAGTKHKKVDLGVTTLNWNDIKNRFMDHIIRELGENNRNQVKKAVTKLSSPKL
jgi:hypothetical protein